MKCLLPLLTLGLVVATQVYGKKGKLKRKTVGSFSKISQSKHEARSKFYVSLA